MHLSVSYLRERIERTGTATGDEREETMPGLFCFTSGWLVVETGQPCVRPESRGVN